MERKRSRIADYRGYMSKHLGPFFGGRSMDKIDRTFVESYLLAKKQEGLSSKTVCDHLNFLHGLLAHGSCHHPVGLLSVARGSPLGSIGDDATIARCAAVGCRTDARS